MDGQSFVEQLRSSEIENHSLIIKDLDQVLTVADMLMNILGEGIKEISVPTEGKDTRMVRLATVTLTVNAVNQIETSRICLCRGFYQPFIVLSRSCLESIMHAQYLSSHPEEAERWAKNKEIRIATVRKSSPYSDEISQLYKTLSDYSHPNLASVRYTTTFKIEEGTGLAVLVGSHRTIELIPVYGKMYLALCSLVTHIFIDDVCPHYLSKEKSDYLANQAEQPYQIVKEILAQEIESSANA